MCCCAKANRNGQPGYSWDGKGESVREPWGPDVPEGWTILYDEPGRCRPVVGGEVVRVDHHSHHYRVVRESSGSVMVLVQHGGGREQLGDDYNARKFAKILEMLPDSDARFYALMAWDGALGDAERAARDSEAQTWRAAAADKRIRTRRYPKRGHTKVWIEDKPRIYDVEAA